MDFDHPVQLGDEIPNFTADSHVGSLTLHNYIDGGWTMIFTQPYAFDPVSTTEIGMVSKLKSEFDARNTKIVATCVESLESIEEWLENIQELQDTEVGFPIVADETGEISRMYGLVRKGAEDAAEGRLPLSSVILIDMDKKVKLQMTYPSNTGRNFYEVIRALDALQLNAYQQVGTPANWKVGEDVFLLPSVSSQQAKELFPKGFHELKPWFRITPQPDIQ